MSRTSLSTLVLSPRDAISRASSKVVQPVRRQQRPKKVPPPRLIKNKQHSITILRIRTRRYYLGTQSHIHTSTHSCANPVTLMPLAGKSAGRQKTRCLIYTMTHILVRQQAKWQTRGSWPSPVPSAVLASAQCEESVGRSARHTWATRPSLVSLNPESPWLISTLTRKRTLPLMCFSPKITFLNSHLLNCLSQSPAPCSTSSHP